MFDKDKIDSIIEDYITSLKKEVEKLEKINSLKKFASSNSINKLQEKVDRICSGLEIISNKIDNMSDQINDIKKGIK